MNLSSLFKRKNGGQDSLNLGALVRSEKEPTYPYSKPEPIFFGQYARDQGIDYSQHIYQPEEKKKSFFDIKRFLLSHTAHPVDVKIKAFFVLNPWKNSW